MKPANVIQDTANQKLLSCRKCRRLSNQLERLRVSHPDYWNKPVPGSGASSCSLLIVGLAPGLHGANRSGEPFVGDSSGNLLDEVLKASGLVGRVRITNAVKCLPVKNLPSSREVKNCSRFLVSEIEEHQLNTRPVLLLLGGIAHRALISAIGGKQSDYPFAHGAVHVMDEMTLVDSYHCSRYNTQTGRLTYPMFLDVVTTAGSMAYP
ncbi:MAG: uracil-DNA glycosylase family protein [Candidatus Azotimanducaceae bacterium WSBS_2022_MAG_OTU7]